MIDAKRAKDAKESACWREFIEPALKKRRADALSELATCGLDRVPALQAQAGEAAYWLGYFDALIEQLENEAAMSRNNG